MLKMTLECHDEEIESLTKILPPTMNETFDHDFEVFFDEFRSALNQDHGAVHLVRRQDPARRPQFDAVAERQPFHDRPGRCRVALAHDRVLT